MGFSFNASLEPQPRAQRRGRLAEAAFALSCSPRSAGQGRISRNMRCRPTAWALCSACFGSQPCLRGRRGRTPRIPYPIPGPCPRLSARESLKNSHAESLPASCTSWFGLLSSMLRGKARPRPSMVGLGRIEDPGKDQVNSRPKMKSKFSRDTFCRSKKTRPGGYQEWCKVIGARVHDPRC